MTSFTSLPGSTRKYNPRQNEDQNSSEKEVQAFKKEYPHLFPVHKAISHSPLSKESTGQDYRGFFNLYVLLLLVVNARMVIENYRKYGFLISTPFTKIPLQDYYCMVFSYSWLFVQLFFALSVQNASSKNRITEKYAKYLCFVNILGVFLVPIGATWKYAYHFCPGLFIILATIIVTMKLISYHIVNYELRTAMKKGCRETYYQSCPYPSNITFHNIIYFYFAPTLCYQPSYPMSEEFRSMFFMRKLMHLTCSLVLLYCVLEQYAIPTVINSIKPIDDCDLLLTLERILKFSVSNVYIWLLFFYMSFHAALNALAELLQFGDRKFYDAWWNANDMGEYWRLWNIPFHTWMRRHVYQPLKVKGYSSHTALSVSFFISAILHEIIVGVATHSVEWWAFFGILFQIPLVYFTGWYHRLFPQSSLGNYFFWVTFCVLGQPTATILYCRAWMNKYGSM